MGKGAVNNVTYCLSFGTAFPNTDILCGRPLTQHHKLTLLQFTTKTKNKQTKTSSQAEIRGTHAFPLPLHNRNCHPLRLDNITHWTLLIFLVSSLLHDFQMPKDGTQGHRGELVPAYLSSVISCYSSLELYLVTDGGQP